TRSKREWSSDVCSSDLYLLAMTIVMPLFEDRDRDQEDDLPAPHVVELAVEGHDDGHRQQVDRDQPGLVLDAVELADDGRHRCGQIGRASCRGRGCGRGV